MSAPLLPRVARAATLLPLVWCAERSLAQEAADDPGTAPPPEAPAAQAPAPEVSRLELALEDAVRIALENNLDLKLQEVTVEISRFDYLGSWGAFDPVLALSGRYTDQEEQGSSQLSGGSVIETESISLTPSLSFPLLSGGNLDLTYSRLNSETNNQFSNLDTFTIDDFTVALNQPLLRGAWREFATTNQRESSLTFQRLQEGQRQTRQEIILAVVNSYWDLVAAIQQRDVAQGALERAQDSERQNRRRLEVGVGTEVDLLQAETQVATQEEQLLLVEFAVRQRMDDLKAQIFRRDKEESWQTYLGYWSMPIEPLTELPEVDAGFIPDWTDSLVVALEKRSELLQQQLEIDAAKIRLQRASSNRLPQLDLLLSASSGAFDGDASDAFSTVRDWEFPTYTAGLTFSTPVGNRLARNAERSARAAVRSARLSYDKVEMQVLSEVRGAVRDVLYQSQAVAAARKSRELAERQLEAEESRYAEGLSTTFQVLQFQQDLSSAEFTEQQALAAYAKALAALRKAEGWLGERERE